MIDCARRWTAASLIGVGRSIPTDRVVYRFVGELRLPGIQLVCTASMPSAPSAMGCGDTSSLGKLVDPTLVENQVVVKPVLPVAPQDVALEVLWPDACQKRIQHHTAKVPSV